MLTAIATPQDRDENNERWRARHELTTQIPNDDFFIFLRQSAMTRINPMMLIYLSTSNTMRRVPLVIIWTASAARTVTPFALDFGRQRCKPTRHHSLARCPRCFGQPSSSSLPRVVSSSRQYLSNYEGADNDDDNYAIEALKSLVDFHEGRWRGRARSFGVSDDVAAGILRRQTSPEYTVSVKLGVDIARRDYKLTETVAWRDDAGGSDGNDGEKTSSRTVSLGESNVDVDDVDASYSLDETLPDGFPSSIVGTDQLQQFMIENCIAINDDQRVRGLAFYGGPNQSLLRIVVCEEQRILEDVGDEPQSSSLASDDNDAISQIKTQQLTAQDLIEMQGDVDRLVDRIVRRSSSNDASATASSNGKSLEQLRRSAVSAAATGTTGPALSPHPVSLLEISSGVWLGDAVIRDFPMVPTSPLEQGGSIRSNRGFGKASSASSTSGPRREQEGFGKWSVGVQKIAWRWMWNFGDDIRQNIDAGRSMGAELEPALSQSLVRGSVAVNEGLSRRVPKDERMVYVDWDGDNVGFLLGSVYIQVPRYIVFDKSRHVRPFYTDFCVFQSAASSSSGGRKVNNLPNDANVGDEPRLPEIVCSKMSRVYNYEGHLKQGCTSFFRFKRFGTEKG